MVREIEVRTSAREEMVDITREVEKVVASSGVKEGVCYIYVPHTTAGVFINEHADPSVVRDVKVTLDRLVPRSGDYRHLEGNSDAHIKATLVGTSQVVLVEGGRLRLGTWQGVFFAEFDGPRRRKVYLKIMEG